MQMTKKEKKLLGAAKRLEIATQRYLEELTEVDKIMRKLPVEVSMRYNLDSEYFKLIPGYISQSIKFELLSSSLEAQIISEGENL